MATPNSGSGWISGQSQPGRFCLNVLRPTIKTSGGCRSTARREPCRRFGSVPFLGLFACSLRSDRCDGASERARATHAPLREARRGPRRPRAGEADAEHLLARGKKAEDGGLGLTVPHHPPPTSLPASSLTRPEILRVPAGHRPGLSETGRTTRSLRARARTYGQRTPNPKHPTNRNPHPLTSPDVSPGRFDETHRSLAQASVGSEARSVPPVPRHPSRLAG